jgi:hypothetical protein
MSRTYRLAHQQKISNVLQDWCLPFYFSKPVMNHLVHFMDGIMTRGFSGTLTDIHRESCHSQNRRTLSHFLTHGKWDEQHLTRIAQQKSWECIKQEAKHTQEPIFVIVDDTVCKKTKPSSQAMYSIQGTDFHYSHTEGKSVWGHAVVQTLIRCGEKVLPYAFSRYESEQNSKIQIACDLVSTVPKSPFPTYVLMDTWYPAESVLKTCALSGFHVISGLKTNRIFYPYGIRQSMKDFAEHIRKGDTDLVTVGHTSYRVYRYEGKLNFIENAVVLLCWDADQPMTPQHMRAFLSTDVSLSNEKILTYYSKRWAIETYFRTMKSNFSFDRYQIRSTVAIHRFWSLLSFTATFCSLTGHSDLLTGLQSWQSKKTNSWIEFVYYEAKAGTELDFIKNQLQAA